MDTLIHGGGLRYKNGIAGEVVTAYQVVYGAGDGRWYLADADVGTSTPLMGLTVDPAIISQRSRILIKGIVQNVTWTWTPGQPIYLSQVAGGMTQTAPALPARTQVVGAAITANTIWFEVESAGLGGGATGCALLEGATAYVGDDSCKAPYTNYFYTGDYVSAKLTIEAACAYAGALGGGSVHLQEGTYTANVVIDEDEILLEGEGWNTIIDGAALGNAVTVSGDRCSIIDLQVTTPAGGGNLFNGIDSTGDDLLIDGVFVNESDDIGIMLNAPRNRVNDCYIFDPDFQGVYIDTLGDGSIVSNNVIWQSGDDGITIDVDGENCVINGNVITGWVNEAIDDNSGTASIGDDNWAGAGSYETQTGIIAVPIVTAGGSWQGRTIEVYNSDEERYFAWTYNDGGFRGVEYL